jgi:hypothetical protein
MGNAPERGIVHFVVAVGLAFGAAAARAQEAVPSYAVSSRLADRISMITLAGTRTQATRVFSIVGSRTAVVAWEAMSGAERFDALKGVIREAVAEAIPKGIR